MEHRDESGSGDMSLRTGKVFPTFTLICKCGPLSQAASCAEREFIKFIHVWLVLFPRQKKNNCSEFPSILLTPKEIETRRLKHGTDFVLFTVDVSALK